VDVYNPMTTALWYDVPNAEYASVNYYFDILSQGIKIRNTTNYYNANAQLYIGFAWAEQFGCYSNAR